MTQVITTVPNRIGRAHQMATRGAFLMAGISLSAWAPLIPYAKNRLRISDGRLGLLLLCLGMGSLIGMPLAGALAARFGCRRMITLSALLIFVMLPVLAVAVHVQILATALLCFGAAAGTLDVVMNIQAVIVERESGRAMMSGFHGLFSVGGIFGAGSISLMISEGATLLSATYAVTGMIVLLLCISFASLLPYGGDRDTPAFALPRGRVLLLGCFCFVLFLAEGSVLDWSAVLLTSVRQMNEAHAGFGYVAFSVAMTVCRLLGDGIVRAAGAARVVLFGTLCAAGGFLLAGLVPSSAVAIVGFGLVGVGASNVVPVMFTAAGRQTAMPTNLAVAAITTLGYAGILLGPVIVGFFANVAGLSAGFAAVALMLMVVALVSTRTRF